MMSSKPQILILGGGLIGLSTADALIRKGAAVTLVDTAPDIMRGASHANSGMIHPSQACHWAGPPNDPDIDRAVYALALDSRARLEARMEALNLQAMRRRMPGCFQIFDSEVLADRAEARLRDRGIEVERRKPRPDLFDRPSLYFPGDRSGDAHLYGRVLADSLRTAGATIRTGVKAVELAGDPEGQVRVHIEGVPFAAEQVVIACGAQTSDVIAPLGLSVDIEPVQGWALDFDGPTEADLPAVPVMDAATRSALTRFEGWFRLSGTWGTTSEVPLRQRWTEIMPDVMRRAGPARQCWSGFRPVSPLGRPFIGPTPIPGLWINAGHGHMGWTLCAGSGALLAQMMLDGVRDTRFAYAAAVPSVARKPR